MTPIPIPFNKPYLTGCELNYITQANTNGSLSGHEMFSERCHQWLEMKLRSKRALLTHSCTAALEMSAILADIRPGDEIIMPSYTFVSTANAFVLRGGVPVFVDIRSDTMNLDERKIEDAITTRTRVIVPVHYAGVSCEMDTIMDIAHRNQLLVIEDAAQGIMSTYKGKALGAIGHMGALSFHDTKNIISGEGGALLINDPEFIDRAEIVREKGTNRSQFFRNQVDKYTWQDIGSSFLPSELTAAFLWAQLQQADAITARRLAIWNHYHTSFEGLEKTERIRRPITTAGCSHNAHTYYLLLSDLADRTKFINSMKQLGINCVFHYIPLHSSPAGKRYGRTHGKLNVTNRDSERLVRLPIFFDLSSSQQERVVEAVMKCLV